MTLGKTSPAGRGTLPTLRAYPTTWSAWWRRPRPPRPAMCALALWLWKPAPAMCSMRSSGTYPVYTIYHTIAACAQVSHHVALQQALL